MKVNFSIALCFKFSFCILFSSSCIHLKENKNDFEINLENGKDIKLKWIPPGKFLLGSSQHDKEWTIQNKYADSAKLAKEGQNTELTKIEKGFWMGQYEITVGQWKAFVNETNYETQVEKNQSKSWAYDQKIEKWSMVEGKSWRTPGFTSELTDEYPACIISYNDALEFCKWLNDKEKGNKKIPENYEFRLPIEAEWEYACQGGVENTIFWWGNDFKSGEGRLNLSSPDSVSSEQPHVMWTKKGWKDGFAFASPVGHFGDAGLNGFGLSDMAGNISEWCMDNYDDSGPHEKYFSNETNDRVIKGGTYRSNAYLLRCASRSKWNENTSCSLVGFRIVIGEKL